MANKKNKTVLDFSEKIVRKASRQVYIEHPDSGAELKSTKPTKEVGGHTGPEPTRFGDWEHKGRCTDF